MAADSISTMDWEGGTISVIVPALMGHVEAGRASTWPFFFAPDDEDALLNASHPEPEHEGSIRCLDGSYIANHWPPVKP
ncbi:hypothetical protein Q31b_32410 [Novipirellula aureliae]|uniref:Uncharacterized protein n=1 Tax=Novipirellula aureliae TaxID=2527966 RepID=A0A5C6DUE6_9BACT|nr:hypothetical protein Q31b_32410 [Novipirellula aureliae]